MTPLGILAYGWEPYPVIDPHILVRLIHPEIEPLSVIGGTQ